MEEQRFRWFTTARESTTERLSASKQPTKSEPKLVGDEHEDGADSKCNMAGLLFEQGKRDWNQALMLLLECEKKDP
jgi:hypothetical protein